MTTTYKDSGVDLELYEESMRRLPRLMHRTFLRALSKTTEASQAFSDSTSQARSSRETIVNLFWFQERMG